MKPWLPLLFSLPFPLFFFVPVNYMPGGGMFIVWYFCLMFILGVISVFLQGNGFEKYSGCGLIAGYLLPLFVFMIIPKPESPGPGQGLDLFFYFGAASYLGILFSTLVGFYLRKVDRDSKTAVSKA